MKNRVSAFLKQVITVIKAIAKAKSALALKNTKFSALKNRFVVLSLLRNKKVLLSTITHKLHAMLPRPHGHGSNPSNEDSEEHSKAIVPYNNINSMQNYHSQSCTSSTFEYMNGFEFEEDEDKYPDLTHTLFDDLENDPGGAGTSVIEMVKNSKEEEGEEFVLEDEIDTVADLFIKKFHRQILMQKQLSFKRYQEMLDRSV